MIPVTIFDCTIHSEEAFNFGPTPGSSLRGALYGALTTMYDTHQQPRDRDDLLTNPVGWLLSLEDEEASGGKDVPRPFAIRPPLDDNTRDTTFGLAFYGKATKTVPVVLTALPLMGQHGIGRGRQPFTVEAIHAVDPLSGHKTTIVDQDGQTAESLPRPPGNAAYEQHAAALPTDALTVHFLTPTRIVQGGSLVHKPHFRAWFHRLIGRVRTISELYTDDPVWVPFKDLLAQADAVKIVDDQTRWVEGWSGSRRDGRVKPLGGFTGTVTYRGDLGPLLPYVLLGQALQVGKNTVKGGGWYAMRDRSAG